MNPEQLLKQEKATLRRAELLALKKGTYENIEVTFRKWIILPDEGIIKFLVAFMFANKLEAKALWAIIIGPSGGGKTQLLDAFRILTDIVEISTLTPNTFLSGMPGPNDASLLPKLSGKVAMFKDWTSIMSIQKDAQGEIMGQFREIWDGRMTKNFGNGKNRSWEGKVSILAASTQAVDLNQQQFTHLGERFVNYRILMPDRKIVAHRSLKNSHQQEQMLNEMQNAVYSFFKDIDYVQELNDLPELEDKLKNELVNLANFSTMARSGVIREFGMKKEVIFVPASEMPTRFTQQLACLALGCMMINKGPLNAIDMKMLYKVALDSIPQTNKMVINELARGDGQTTSEIANALGYPTEPIKIYLQNLALLKICRRIKGEGKADRWKMNEEFSDIIRHYEGIEELTEEEKASRKAENDEKYEEPDYGEYGSEIPAQTF